jgi:hypothetical protein
MHGLAKSTKIVNSKNKKFGITFKADLTFDNVASLAAGASISAS